MSIFASLSASKQSSLPGPSTTTFRATRRVEAEAEEEEDQIPIPEAQQRPSRLRLDRAAANRFIVNAVRAAEAKGKEQIQSQERAKQKSLLPNNAKHQWPSANAQTNKKSLPKRTTTATTATTATAKRKPLKSTAEVTAADSNDAPKKRATTAKTTVKKKSVAAKKKKLLLMKKQNPLNRNGERESDHDDAAADDGNVKGAKRKKTRGWLVRQFPEVLLAVPSLPPLCSSEEKRGRRVQYYMCIGKCKRLLLYQQLRASACTSLLFSLLPSLFFLMFRSISPFSFTTTKPKKKSERIGVSISTFFTIATIHRSNQGFFHFFFFQHICSNSQQQ
ncbi:Gustatory receptor, variant 3 [Balamuthia mandrillaris]